MNKIYKFLVILFFAASLAGCEEDSPTLEIAEVQLNYNFEKTGGTKFATVKSNQQFTATSDQLWCTTEIYPGGNNNNLRISTQTNDDAAIRTATIIVTAEGSSTILITVTQNAASPFITVTERSITIPPLKDEFTLEISANLVFSYELPAWIHPSEDNIPTIGKGIYRFNVDLLSTGERDGVIIIKGAGENSGINPVSIPVIQTSEVLPLIDEHFDWAISSSTDIYTATNEVRLDNWPAEGKVWTSSTANVYDVWTRKGYLKFCRGNTGADLVSPKLAGIVGTKDVVVTFKACGYLSATGVKDKYHEFNISVTGGGVPSVTYFSVDNYPDTSTREHGEGWVWQDDPSSEYTFTIIGATSETQIIFLAGPKLGTIDSNSRMGLDDVKVVFK